MGGIFSGFVWFVIVAATISYGSYLLVGSTIQARAFGKTAPIQVEDSVRPGIHQLSGIIFVPSNCHQLSVRTEDTGLHLYKLIFETWEEPSIPCEHEPVPRPFSTIVFAPSAGVRFLATLDGMPIPIIVSPRVRWVKATSSIIKIIDIE